ncbi:MAG TPA: ABC transporter ATP-binding protein/permease [Candidatus Blautia pullicola]|mgnify:CR=1 FL=1|jgi:ATP-binding cassette subfamily B multidrug efflux pump|uniref:ABC transporter ATP-binding protein/permease n=1 Tax=Candidatus Blautia pullicola TaxID=2838498 RepID=A0A9D2JT45_9FIRM|nr:ABC transporter ATP-binding protein/permease [Candidatus Blautia pullicola]
MLKMFHYMKERWYYLVMIIALLFVQAFCDLSLPDYTSKIVNVGIQQKGVEDGVPDTIRLESMERLELFMKDEDIEFVQEQYTAEEENYVLKDITEQDREKLNEILGIPELVVSQLQEDSSEEVAAIKEQMRIPQEADIFQVLQQIPKEQLEQMMEEQTKSLEEMPESIVTQTAVLYVQQEYEAQGQDMDQMQIQYILFSGLKMLGLAFLGMAAAVTVTFLSARVAATLGRNLRNSVYRKVITFSGAELNHFSTASLITRSTNDVQQIQLLFAMIFRIVLYAPILGIGGVYKVFQTDASMTWILALAVVLIMIFVAFLFKVAMPKFTKLQYLIDKLNLVAREILTGVYVIRAFSTEKHEEERFEDANINLTKTNLFVNRCMTFMMPVMMLIMNGVTVLIVWNGAHAVNDGTMQVGNMMAFMQYAMQIIMAFLMITMMSIMIPRASVAAKRINEVMDTQVSIRDGEAHKTPMESRKGEVAFEQVGFAYPGADEETISDISFTAKKGETVAFIGSTGSGKSTLVNLIPRFFDVTRGRILVDGVDIRDMNLHDLRDRIGYVPQKGVLFSGTIDSNIRYGKEEAGEEEVKRAAEIAQAWDFIQEKEKGIQAEIAQGGTNVSGGQKQRLSIARAIAKNPEIYIFDDSFSALDYKTDVTLRRALKKETKEATTLIVAQRISTILHADKILVLDEGKVVGQGTHQELLKSCDVYRQIAMSQLSEEELANE